MRLTEEELEVLTEMHLHYMHRVIHAKQALMRPNANPLFEKQADRDKARADVIDKVLKAHEADKAWGPG